jgi:hypothetical protein
MPIDITICDIVGRIVMKRKMQANPGEVCAVSLRQLPTGIFTVEHAANGASVGQKMKFTHMR